MKNLDEKINNSIHEAIFLSYFKAFCQKNSNSQRKRRVRNILSNSNNKCDCIYNIFKNELSVEFNKKESSRMLELVTAYLNKSTYRKKIPQSIKHKLLDSQDFKCSICGAEIDIDSHADHIIPFKLVGDELKNNLQMLCEKCNSSKNASIDYQIRFLLKLI